MSDLTPVAPDPEPSDVVQPDLLGGGGFDMGALLEQAMEMQQQLLEAQSATAETVVEGQSGGGAVTIRVTGGMEFESVVISPAAVDPDDVELLQDLVLAALHDAVDQIGRLQQPSMGALDLGAMGGALGLGTAASDADDDDEDDELDDDDPDDDPVDG